MDTEQREKQQTLMVPKEVIGIARKLAGLSGKTLKDWGETDLKDILESAYRDRVQAEQKKLSKAK